MVSTAPAGAACASRQDDMVDRDDVRAAKRGQPDEHQSDGTGAVHDDGVAELDTGLGHAVHHGGQRLQRRSGGEGQAVGMR